ncbi:hypothetical protein ACWGST_03755 [Agromyces sp. NPDC055520]
MNGDAMNVAPAPHVYATYFDSGYLARGLTLFESLRAWGDDAAVWVMCLDEGAKAFLDQAADPRIRTISVADLEVEEPELLAVKDSRTRMEYYFTCTPLLMRYVMRRQSDPSTIVTYLDADLGYFGDPAGVFASLGDGSIGIIEHRYPDRLARRLGKYGRFNVGWVGIRADEAGRACLDWWAESCLEWCFDTPDAGRYADQGYLDWFPERFSGVVILPDLGFDVAPWNTSRHKVSVSDGGSVVVGGTDPLVFFHFHGIKRRGGWHVTSQLVYGSPAGRALREHVYAPYLARLDRSTALVERSGQAPSPSVSKRGNGLRGVLFAAQRAVLDRVSIITGNAVRVSRDTLQAAD